MVWYWACYWMCMRVYYRLHYDIFTHTAHYHSKYRVWYTHIHMTHTWMIVRDIVSHVHYTRPKLLRLSFSVFFFDTHSEFFLLFCIRLMFAICCWLKLKLTRCKNEQIVIRSDNTLRYGFRRWRSQCDNTKYHTARNRRNHVISQTLISLDGNEYYHHHHHRHHHSHMAQIHLPTWFNIIIADSYLHFTHTKFFRTEI